MKKKSKAKDMIILIIAIVIGLIAISFGLIEIFAKLQIYRTILGL